MQPSCHEYAITGTEESDLANQWFDDLKILVNPYDIFIEIILLAGANSRFQQLTYIEFHCNHTHGNQAA